MKLAKENALVQAWYQMIIRTDFSYTLDDVPDIYNLREIVQELLNEEGES